MEHYNLHLNTCKHHQAHGLFKNPKNSLNLLTRTCHSVLPSPIHSCLLPDNKLLITFSSFPGDSLAFYSLFFVSSKPLMLSVVNGLASCFKAAIAECKFWLLRFIYILVSWSLLYIWVVAMGWHNVNKSRNNKKNCESCVLSIWVFCNFFEKFVELK